MGVFGADRFVDDLLAELVENNPDVTDEQLGEVIRQGFDAVEERVPAFVESLRRDGPGLMRWEREMRSGFEARLHEVWGEALDGYFQVTYGCGEVAQECAAARDDDPRFADDTAFHLLTELHARAYRTALEIHALLRSGFPAGAMARQRTLHEIAVVAAVVEGSPDPKATAERYYDHQTIHAASDAEEYEAAHDGLGYDPYDPADLAALRADRDEVLARHGKHFGHDNGWAAHLTDPHQPAFWRLERLAKLSHLRPFYRWACHSLHADSQGLSQNRYERGGRVGLMTGATNAGLSDPGQSALVSLMQTTATLYAYAIGHDTVSITDGLMLTLAVQGLQALQEQAMNAFHRAENEIAEREAALQEEAAAAWTHLQTVGSATAAEVADALSVTEDDAYATLEFLREQGGVGADEVRFRPLPEGPE